MQLQRYSQLVEWRQWTIFFPNNCKKKNPSSIESHCFPALAVSENSHVNLLFLSVFSSLSHLGTWAHRTGTAVWPRSRPGEAATARNHLSLHTCHVSPTSGEKETDTGRNGGSRNCLERIALQWLTPKPKGRIANYINKQRQAISPQGGFSYYFGRINCVFRSASKGPY